MILAQVKIGVTKNDKFCTKKVVIKHVCMICTSMCFLENLDFRKKNFRSFLPQNRAEMDKSGQLSDGMKEKTFVLDRILSQKENNEVPYDSYLNTTVLQ